MANPADLFAQISNAVLDLQAAGHQSYSRSVKTLAKLLAHPDLAAANAALTADVNLDAFLDESIKSQGSFTGSAELAWPERKEDQLGLTLLLVERFGQNPDFMAGFGHTYFNSGSRTIISDIREVTRQLIIPFARDYKAYVMSHGRMEAKLVMPLSNKVFIVHGHDEGARESVARFLRDLGLKPIILHEQANRGRTVIEKVEANGDVGFAVVLLTPDDEGCVKGGKPEPRARQNVLLELGYFIGRLGRDKVCSLKRGDVEIPSDFAGVVWEAMDSGGGWKIRLGRELDEAGYSIDWNEVMRP